MLIKDAKEINYQNAMKKIVLKNLKIKQIA